MSTDEKAPGEMGHHQSEIRIQAVSSCSSCFSPSLSLMNLKIFDRTKHNPYSSFSFWLTCFITLGQELPAYLPKIMNRNVLYSQVQKKKECLDLRTGKCSQI